MKLRSLLFVLMAAVPQISKALDIRSTKEELKSSLTISGESSNFSLEAGSIRGNGLRVDFSHAFTYKISFEAFLSTAFGGGGSVSSSFTGFGGYAFYNLFSSCCEQKRSVFFEGVPVVKEIYRQKYLFQLGAGLNQFLHNGDSGVYSSSGPGIGVNYIVRISQWQVKTAARFTQMVTRQTKVQGTFLSIGLLFPL